MNNKEIWAEAVEIEKELRDELLNTSLFKFKKRRELREEISIYQQVQELARFMEIHGASINDLKSIEVADSEGNVIARREYG